MEKKELMEQLELLKKELETAINEKQKKDIEVQIKALEDKIPDTKKLETEVESVKTLATEVKTMAEEAKTSLAAITVKVDEADKAQKANQPAIDQLLVDVKEIKERKSPEQKGVTLEAAIENALNEGDNFKNLEMMALNHKDREKRFSMELKTVGDVSISANYTGGTRGLQTLRPGIIENPERKVHIRQLLDVGSIGPGTEFVFMRENGDGEGAIAPTAETGTKPQIDIDLEEASVKIETIAGWMRVTRKSMTNIPGFRSFLTTRLPEKLLRVEDAQLLTGDGNTPNLKGIMTTGNHTDATSTEAILIEQLIDSIAQLEDDEERSATGILLRPVNYYNFFKNKASGSGEYDLPQNVTFVNGTLYISGIPVFASTALTDGKYIVGDWRMGAQLLIQEGMRIEFFEQDGTNVRENKITIRIEETVAFPVYGDNYFIVGDVPDES